MKVTALIPDELVDAVQKHAAGKTLTESLIKALREWVNQQRIAELNREIARQPLEFAEDFDAEEARSKSRRR